MLPHSTTNATHSDLNSYLFTNANISLTIETTVAKPKNQPGHHSQHVTMGGGNFWPDYKARAKCVNLFLKVDTRRRVEAA
jgi:hypothetical protein